MPSEDDVGQNQRRDGREQQDVARDRQGIPAADARMRERRGPVHETAAHLRAAAEPVEEEEYE